MAQYTDSSVEIKQTYAEMHGFSKISRHDFYAAPKDEDGLASGFAHCRKCRAITTVLCDWFDGDDEPYVMSDGGCCETNSMPEGVIGLAAAEQAIENIKTIVAIVDASAGKTLQKGGAA